MTMGDTGLFSELKKFQNNKLKKVSTLVTNQDGSQHIETMNDYGNYSMIQRLDNSAHGFIVDTKADLNVGIISPNLMIGSQDVAIEEKILNDHKVTHILNVGYGIPNFFEEKFTYKNVEILDTSDTEIQTKFELCFQFIDDAVKQGCALVHCNAGVSRTATIVIAYLMNRNQIRFQKAYDQVKKARSNIKPNDGFLKALHDYDKYLFQ